MKNPPQDMTLEALIAFVQKYHPKEKFDVIEKAWKHAEKLHEGQTRKSGEAYFIHPVAVATTLAELMMDSATVAAGLLHDVLEDCPDECTIQLLQKEYGAEMAQLVDGVTKLTKLDSSKEEQRIVSKEEQHAESLRKMILAMAKDVRVVIIKLADRLHNMRTMKFQSPDRQIAISRETLDIYAPLAHRLGVYSMKSELEDLAFSYLEPEKYEELKTMVGMKRQERESVIQTFMRQLSNELDIMGIHYDIGGRPKHFYSIYKKMEKQNIPFEQIFDLTAVRVIVETVHDCYSVLGLVHTLWKQVPNRFKDYISTPKANQYQSIHTTVVGQGGNALEIQIRTREMHRTAEYGIASHWLYKEGKQSGGDLDRKLEWLRQFLDWQTETTGAQEFIDELKVDLFAEEVFVFTPKGDVINLPRGATPLDFAYRIHSAVGNKCIGAKANGRIITLDSELSTGDFVEIMTSNAAKGPSQDWMKIVKTPQARAKIRQFFKKELKAENIDLGRSMLEREAQRNAAQLSSYLKPELIDPILKKHGFLDLDDIYSSIGFGAMRASSVFSRLVAEQKRLEQSKPAPPPPEFNFEEENQRRQQLASSHGVYVEGEPGMLVRYAKCCNPVPGDDIVGYTTRGRGVTIHKNDCPNALNSEIERIIDVSWDASAESIYTAGIRILAHDKKGLLSDVSMLIGTMNAPIEAVTAKVNKDGTCIITLTVQTQSKAQLDELIKTIKKQPEVINVFRMT